MRTPVIGSNTCNMCNASYASDAQLREHQRASHRGDNTEKNPKAAAVVPSEDPQA